MEKKGNPIAVAVPLVIPEPALLDILRTALDWAAGYWLQGYEIEFTQSAGNVVSVRVLRMKERDSEYDIDPQVSARTDINAERIAHALASLANGTADQFPSDNGRRTFAYVVGELTKDGRCGADGPHSDAVLQVAVFGSVVYA